MSNLKYAIHIDEAFDRLKFTPRIGQREAVNAILTECIDNKKRNIILCAPTGTGKSIIGAASAEALTLAKGGSALTPKSSISVVSTNVLAKQYGETFGELEKEKKYIMLKGAANYPCSVLTTPEEEVQADSCAWFNMVSNSEFADTVKQHCDSCEYRQSRKVKNLVRHLTTNYSYFFIDRMYTGQFENRDLIVWDEAHLVNDLFSDHNAIHFSQKKLQALAMEIADMVKMIDPKIGKSLAAIINDCGKKDKITDKNYKSYLTALHEIYTDVQTEATSLATTALRSSKTGQYTKLSKIAKKYEGMACKIDDFFNFNYPHVFEYKEEEKAVSVKPIFVGEMIKELQCADHNLFMSATISEEFMATTLNLSKEDTAFIKLEPTFPKENKEVVFFDAMSLNYSSLQNADVVKKLRHNVASIVKKHVADGDRGIILTPSFKLQNEIMAELQPQIKAKTFKMFEHKQGEKLEHVLKEFKAYTGGEAVLISPAMFEGIDLPGDLSRFQILVKAPFPSLADKRMKYILDHHSNIYSGITIMKIVQGAGRSVRSATDHATTYCMDLNGQRLFTSSTNIWKNEFTTRFTKFL